MTQNATKNKNITQTPAVQKRPNESGVVNVEGFIKIFDPKTKETFVEKRA